MSYFNSIDTDLVMQSSLVIQRLTTQEMAQRFVECYGIRQSFEPVLQRLEECRDSPKLRHWVSVSRSMVRAKIKVLDPEPRFMAHFFVDTLDPERISEIHSLRALEIVLEDAIIHKMDYEWCDFTLLAPARFSILGVGTIINTDLERGFAVSYEAGSKKLLVTMGRSAFEKSLTDGVQEISGNLVIESGIQVDTMAGQIHVPLDVPGLADCYHSNGPVVRGMVANTFWAETLRKAISILFYQDAQVAKDCIRLSPAALALHCGGTSFGSSSPQEVMGLVFLPGVSDPFDVAECFLHESLHQKLYRVEEGAPLHEGVFGDDEIYYSPWRSDGRPLRMLIHGAYVFAGVSNFWAELYKSSDDKKFKRSASFHAYYRAKQAELAMSSVRKFDHLTSMGEVVSQVIEEGLTASLKKIDAEPFVRDEANGRIKAHQDKFSGSAR